MLEKLEKLADLLNKIPRSKFDYRYYICVLNRKGNVIDGATLHHYLKHRRGTTACALGWVVALWPDDWQWNDAIIGGLTLARGSTRWPTDDAAKFFGITGYEADYLFIPKEREWKDSPKTVAKKIHKFIKEKRDAGETGTTGKLLVGSA